MNYQFTLEKDGLTEKKGMKVEGVKMIIYHGSTEKNKSEVKQRGLNVLEGKPMDRLNEKGHREVGTVWGCNVCNKSVCDQ